MFVRGLAVGLWACLLLPLAAQESARRPTFVRVVDAAGEPVAGAVVTFAGCVPHLGTRIGPHDVQVVASDERGRARARLQDGLCYVAWATLEHERVRLVSDVASYFGAGALMELVCRDAGAPRSIRVVGSDAWSDVGPLRCFAVTPTPGIESELQVHDGVALAPILPEWRIEVRTADGRPLLQADAARDELVIPPPQRLAVRVVDEHGRPVAGARLEQRIGREPPWHMESGGFDDLTRRPDGIFRALGEVGEQGTTELTLCTPGDPLRDASVKELMLFATAPGFASGACGRLLDQFYVDDRRVPRPPDSELTFTLRRAEPLVAWVGAVPDGTVAHLLASCPMWVNDTNFFQDLRSFVVPVSAEGVVNFPAVPADVQVCQLALVAPSGSPWALPLLPAIGGRKLPLPEPSPPGSAQLPLCRLALQVTNPQGGPASGLVVAVVPKAGPGLRTRDLVSLLPLDAAGGANLQLLPGTWNVIAMAAAGVAIATIDCTPGTRSETIALQPWETMLVRLVDASGTPVVGATVAFRGLKGWPQPENGEDDQPVWRIRLDRLRGRWSELRTDGDGRIAIPVLPELELRVRLDVGERRTDDFTLEANDRPLELRLP